VSGVRAAEDRGADRPGAGIVVEGLEHLDLEVTGMTCASCAARIEKKLNRLDGVTASVNYALGRAAVDFDAGRVAPGDLVAAVEAAGYGAELPAPPSAGPDAGADVAPDADPPELAALRRRLLISAALALPVVVVSMVPALQFRNWQWAALTLASPVAVWGAWPFHVAAWRNARHGTATMDTLISVGVTAAYVWSLVALFWGHAGMPGMQMGTALFEPPTDPLDHAYLEVAAAVPTFILLGRYLEARAKRRAGAALEALLHLGAKDVAILGDDGLERRRPGADRHRRRGGGRRLGGGQQHADGGERPRRGRSRRRRGRRHGQRLRSAGRAGHPGGRRHPAGADGAAGHRRPERQGPGPAARRPRRRRLRARRHRRVHRHPRGVDVGG
jgi:copper chaperone CopZ